MALASGTRVGIYEVTAKIGEGGMGEVYQARDTTLDRDVALKVLPEAFTADPDRLARFQREAKVLASLNHPNIGAIHGLESTEDAQALVLELIEGPTLADRIAEGLIPVEEALNIANQIAEALEAAHEQGIVHRDLKPANVKVKADGTVKVLDFGLAKAATSDASGANATTSATMSLTASATQMGMVIGTAAYMAPEQAKGKPVDKRADIWAFGVVLLEMLGGKRVFEGETASETLAAVMMKEPDWGRLPTDLPPKLDNLVRRCLEKDPRERVRDVGDVRLAMKGAFETMVAVPADTVTAPPMRLWQRPLPALIALLLVAVIAGVGVWILGSAGPSLPATVTRFGVYLAAGDVTDFGDGIALSPDGKTLVYAGTRDGMQQLFLRNRDQMESRSIPGTEGAVFPFFSPDGEWVGFFTNDSLKKISLAGGPPVTLCASGQRQGATWGPNDTIVFSSSAALGLMQVSAAGGEPHLLTEPLPEEGAHVWPAFVPGGEAIIYTSGNTGAVSDKQVNVVSIETGAQQTLVNGAAGMVTHTGHLVFAREASLWAVPFDIEQLAVSGEPAPMLEGVQVNSGTNWAHFTFATDGTLVYLPTTGLSGQLSLVWVDRDGQETPMSMPPRSYLYPRVSPDGSRVAVTVTDQQQDTWVWDLTGETLRRLTLDPGTDRYGEWTPDGQQVLFSSNRDGGTGVYWRDADGSGEAVRLLSDNTLSQFPQSVAPDGNSLLLRRSVGVTGDSDLLLFPLTEDGASAEELLVTQFDERNGVISPGGNWFAYESDASGEREVYVRPFPDADTSQFLISTAGGTAPTWAPDGTELYFVNDNKLFSVPVETDGNFVRGAAAEIIDSGYVLGNQFGRNYDIHPSGDRFLLVKSLGGAGSASSASLHVVLNWFEELKERVPVP